MHIPDINIPTYLHTIKTFTSIHIKYKYEYFTVTITKSKQRNNKQPVKQNKWPIHKQENIHVMNESCIKQTINTIFGYINDYRIARH